MSRKGLKGFLALLVLWAGYAVLTARSGDPRLFPADQDGIEVILISNGYHAGLAIPRQPLANLAGSKGMSSLISVTVRFSHYEWIEFGWGDSEFYRSTPTANAMQWQLALKALLGSGEGAVLHVVGFEKQPEHMLPDADHLRIRISQEGLERLAARLDQSFSSGADHQPEEMGEGLYGPSLFYRATGHFNLFHVCNHWIADLLDAAGVPTSPGLAFLPVGIRTDLKWRSGLERL